MRTPELLERLFEIERSIGVEDNETILNKLIDLEECVLLMQRERAEILRTVSNLGGCSAQSSSLAFTATRAVSRYLRFRPS